MLKELSSEYEARNCYQLDNVLVIHILVRASKYWDISDKNIHVSETIT